MASDPIPAAAMQLPADHEDLILKYGSGRAGADPCPVPGCPISAQEHHRLARGIMAENTELKRQLHELHEGRRAEREAMESEHFDDSEFISRR